MRNYILIILSALMISCSNTETGSKSDSSAENTNDTNETNANVYKITEDSNMVDVSKLLKENEDINFLKELTIRKHRGEDLNALDNAKFDESNSIGFEVDFDFVNKKHEEFKKQLETGDQLNREYEIINKMLLQCFPQFKTVSSSLYEEKLKDVFGIKNNQNYRYDDERQVLIDPRFLIYAENQHETFRFYFNGMKFDHKDNMAYFHINDLIWSIPYDVFYHIDRIIIPSFVNRVSDCIDFDVFGNYNDLSISWGPDGFLSKKYNDENEVLTARNPIYEKCMNEGKLYVYKHDLDLLYHYNNYIFYESKSSLTWLISNAFDLVKDLMKTYNYDKDTTINRLFLKEIKSKCFDDDGFKGKYCDPILGTDIYGNTVYHENMLKYLADNCYDPNEKDDLGLDNCDIIEYLLRYCRFPKEDSKIEKYDCRLLALLAYYQLKVYDVYMKEIQAAPRCWIDFFAASLYNKNDDCESLFYQTIKENNFYGLDFAERCQELYKETRGRFIGGGPD